MGGLPPTAKNTKDIVTTDTDDYFALLLLKILIPPFWYSLIYLSIYLLNKGSFSVDSEHRLDSWVKGGGGGGTGLPSQRRFGSDAVRFRFQRTAIPATSQYHP